MGWEGGGGGGGMLLATDSLSRSDSGTELKHCYWVSFYKETPESI